MSFFSVDLDALLREAEAEREERERKAERTASIEQILADPEAALADPESCVCDDADYGFGVGPCRIHDPHTRDGMDRQP